MNKYTLTTMLFLGIVSDVFSQFPGPVGTPGTTAIHKDSNVFIGWATGCSIVRGYQDISNPSLGYTLVGDSTMALEKPGINGVVSLGDGGYAILTFTRPIRNGLGFDFAVFENSFSDIFLELAVVEVSSDGINYVRFPAISNTQITSQIGPFDNVGDATKINNLAGKYRANYGTPFDLAELDGITGLNIDAITHIKIIDVVGSINPLYATYDSKNNPINDPFPTAFASGGFDLDGVGVIHQQATSLNELSSEASFEFYPNPISAGQTLMISSTDEINQLMVYNSNGGLLYSGAIDQFNTINFNQGFYFIHMATNKGVSIKKLIVQ